MVGCQRHSHRNRRHIADGQVAGFNVGSEASSSRGRLTPFSLKRTSVMQPEQSVAVHDRWAERGHIQPFANGSFVEIQFSRIFCLLVALHDGLTGLSGQQSVVGRAGTEPRLILEAHPQSIQLFCVRIPAFSCLCSGFDSRLNGLWPFIFNSFNQSEFVSSIYLRPLESGYEFGMGNGLIHKYFII
jgi:hypothetical protein